MARHQRVLLLVSTGVFLSTMDSSMVNVALPTLMRVFHAPLVLTEWVVLVYLLTVTATLIIWGALSTRIGRGRLYGWGLTAFGLGSLCCGLSPAMGWLIAARGVQGLGAAMMMAMGPALIKAAFPGDRLGSGLGMVGIATSLGLMTGPVISGLILHWGHWRLLFLVTVPVALLARGRTGYLLAEIDGGRHEPGRDFDLPGSLLYIGAVVSTALALAHGSAGEAQPQIPLPVAVGAALVLWPLFVRHQLRAPRPLVELAVFRRLGLVMALVCAMLSFTVLFLVLILMPFFLSTVQQRPANQIGLLMMSVPLCVFFVAPVAGRLHDRIGARIIASVGLSVCMFSLWLLSGLGVASPPAVIVLSLALLGFGQAMFLAPNSAAALSGVSHHESGLIASLLATSRNMGMLLGTALAGLLFGYFFARASGGLDIRDFRPEMGTMFLTALRRTFLAGMGISGLAVLMSLLRGPENGGEGNQDS